MLKISKPKLSKTQSKNNLKVLNSSKPGNFKFYSSIYQLSKTHEAQLTKMLGGIMLILVIWWLCSIVEHFIPVSIFPGILWTIVTFAKFNCSSFGLELIPIFKTRQTTFQPLCQQGNQYFNALIWTKTTPNLASSDLNSMKIYGAS